MATTDPDNDTRIDGSRATLVFTREQWQAVLDALEGDDSSRDVAFDAIQRFAPRSWLEAQE